MAHSYLTARLMIDSVVPVLADALLYVGTTAVISMSGREFRFYNLSAGLWLVLGGWFTAWILGFDGGHVEPWWLLGAATLLVVFVTSPIWLRERLRINPLAYLFVALGVVLVGVNGSENYLLRSPNAWIPLALGPAGIGILLAGVFLGAVVSGLVMKSGWWSRLALQFRIATAEHSEVWWSLAGLIALEAGLLLGLGGVGAFVHKGVFGGAEIRALIPILALLASRGQAIWAMVVSFVVVVAMHGMIAFSPDIGGVNTGGYAKAVVLIALAVPVVYRAWPNNPLSGIRRAKAVPGLLRKYGMRSSLWRGLMRIWDSAHYRDIILTAVVVIGVGLVGPMLLSVWPGMLVPEQLLMTGRVLLYAIVVWLVYRYVGVFSITVPAIAALPVYAAIELSMSWPELVGIMAAVAAAFGAYVTVLRLVDTEVAIIVDVTVVVSLFQMIRSTPNISGIHGIVILPPYLPVADWRLVLPTVVVILSLLWGVIVVGARRNLRARTLALMNMAVGRAHGVRSIALLAAVGGMLLFPTLFGNVIYHSVSEAVSSEQVGLEFGLTVGLLGYFMARSRPWVGALLVVGIYGVLGVGLLGAGAVFQVAVGITLLAAARLFGQEEAVAA